MTYNNAMATTQGQKNNKLLAAYLIVGEDELKRQRAIERLRARVAALGDLDFNHDIFDGEHASGSDIAVACNTVPFASELRLVELTNAEKLKKQDAEVLIAYLAAPCETTVLALLSPKLAKNTRLYKAIAQVGASSIVDCTPPKRYELTKMLRNMAVGYGFTLSDASALKLVELVGEDTVRLDKELAKISLAVSGQDAVSPREIEALVARSAQTKPWELVDAMSERDLKKTLTCLHRMNESPLRLIALCTSRLRELACAQSLAARGQTHQLADTLGLPSWRVKNHVQWSHNYSEDELRHAFVTLRDCERQLKSSSNAASAFEDWLVEFIVRS